MDSLCFLSSLSLFLVGANEIRRLNLKKKVQKLLKKRYFCQFQVILMLVSSENSATDDDDDDAL